jgi:beta-lactamase superfamily II metal-dependent hydrolase
MIFSLDVQQARKGDCLLLHFGTKDEPGLVLIDGGPKSVYQPYLKPRLRQIKAARGLAEQEPLLVDLLMVSHVDDDHIQGILDLTREEIAAKQAHRPQLLNVQSFWHNSFDEIIDHEPEDLTASMKKQFGEAAVSGGGELPDVERLAVEEKCSEHPEVVTSSLKVLASIEQGFRLRQDAEGLGFPRNPEFGGELIMARKNGKAIDIAQGLKFTVAGPMQPELEALRKKHIQWLEDLKKQRKSPPAALAAYIDPSVPNLSSIVVLAELGNKRILLTGDARGDKILKGLQLAGLLGSGAASKMHVDLLKVPHHGSANNLDHDFFERITAQHYVFSGDGEHGNPEREALEMLLGARGDADYTLHFTYPIEKIDVEREKDWVKQQQQEKDRKKKNPEQKIRPDWSPKTHSLVALFEDHEDFAKKVSIVEDGKPHVINLLDEVGF